MDEEKIKIKMVDGVAIGSSLALCVYLFMCLFVYVLICERRSLVSETQNETVVS